MFGHVLTGSQDPTMDPQGGSHDLVMILRLDQRIISEDHMMDPQSGSDDHMMDPQNDPQSGTEDPQAV